MIIGLTGGPGTGKSLAADFLKEKGAIIVSGDAAGRKAVERFPSVMKRLTQTFGRSILKPDGRLDRRALGRIVFSSSEARRKLNEIVHPPLLRNLRADLRSQTRSHPRKLIVIDAALIFEWGIADWCDYVLVVTARRNLRLKRMMADGLSRRAAVNRIRSQMPDREKAALADYVIENNGSKANLRRQVAVFLKALKKAKQT